MQASPSAQSASISQPAGDQAATHSAPSHTFTVAGLPSSQSASDVQQFACASGASQGSEGESPDTKDPEEPEPEEPEPELSALEEPEPEESEPELSALEEPESEEPEAEPSAEPALSALEGSSPAPAL